MFDKLAAVLRIFLPRSAIKSRMIDLGRPMTKHAVSLVSNIAFGEVQAVIFAHAVDITKYARDAAVMNRVLTIRGFASLDRDDLQRWLFTHHIPTPSALASAIRRVPVRLNGAIYKSTMTQVHADRVMVDTWPIYEEVQKLILDYVQARDDDYDAYRMLRDSLERLAHKQGL